MAKIATEIIDIIKKFISNASLDNIHISTAILFGSYAKGTNSEWSDIDVALVSDDFVGNRFLDSEKIASAILNSSIDIQSHTFRPEEFTPSNPFVKEILNYGVKVQ